MGRYVTGKDIVLFTIGQIGVDGALYKAMEFTGSAIRSLSMDSRFTICNMAIEAGGKSGIIAPDDITKAYVEGRFRREPRYYHVRPRRRGTRRPTRWKADEVPLMVAKPHLPSNTQPADELNSIKIDQVVIGSCTNGRIEDLRQAAEILRGRKVHKDVRCIVIPATQAIWKQAMDEGLFDVFVEAEAAVSAPTCGPCLGGHMGVLAKGERAVSTTNRNFVGRMGHPGSEVYLAGPYVAAASAVAGHIATPTRSARLRAGARHDRRKEAVMTALRGRAWTFGRDVDTDLIIPARYLNMKTAEELAAARHGGRRPRLRRQGQAGRHHGGQGELRLRLVSREHAPIALKGAGVSVVIAKSFARIFYRNAFNTGPAHPGGAGGGGRHQGGRRADGRPRHRRDRRPHHGREVPGPAAAALHAGTGGGRRAAAVPEDPRRGG